MSAEIIQLRPRRRGRLAELLKRAKPDYRFPPRPPGKKELRDLIARPELGRSDPKPTSDQK